MTPAESKSIEDRIYNRVLTKLQIDKGTKVKVKRNDSKKKRDLDEQFKVKIK